MKIKQNPLCQGLIEPRFITVSELPPPVAAAYADKEYICDSIVMGASKPGVFLNRLRVLFTGTDCPVQTTREIHEWTLGQRKGTWSCPDWPLAKVIPPPDHKQLLKDIASFWSGTKTDFRCNPADVVTHAARQTIAMLIIHDYLQLDNYDGILHVGPGW